MAQKRFRFFNFSPGLFLKLALLAGVFILVQTPQVLLATGIPERWETNEYQPSIDIGTPINTQGGGTRGSASSCLSASKPLKALVPGDHFGTTVAAYPSFLAYMPALSPQASPLPVEFVLEDKNSNEVYKSTFKTSGKSGIVTISLPTQAGLVPLEIGQDYKWSLSIICQPDDRSKDISVQGLVRRVELNPTLSNQLRQASPQKQVELYAEARLWQDALATLAQLRRDNPNDSAIAADWAKLLRSANLEDVTQESLLPGSTTPQRSATSSSPP
jgi:hypothetical protein